MNTQLQQEETPGSGQDDLVFHFPFSLALYVLLDAKSKPEEAALSVSRVSLGEAGWKTDQQLFHQLSWALAA